MSIAGTAERCSVTVAALGETRAKLIWGGVVVGFLSLEIVMCLVAITLSSGDESFAVVPGYHEQALQWDETRAAHGKDGPFLFGAFTAADAMYAPVVTRFRTYDVKLTAASQAYVDAMLALPSVKDWYAGAAAESWVLDQYEY